MTLASDRNSAAAQPNSPLSTCDQALEQIGQSIEVELLGSLESVRRLHLECLGRYDAWRLDRQDPERRILYLQSLLRLSESWHRIENLSQALADLHESIGLNCGDLVNPTGGEALPEIPV